MLRYKRELKNLGNRVGLIEDQNLDVEELSGEKISAQDILKYLDKMQKEMSSRMLTKKDLADMRDRLKEIDTCFDQIDELREE